MSSKSFNPEQKLRLIETLKGYKAKHKRSGENLAYDIINSDSTIFNVPTNGPHYDPFTGQYLNKILSGQSENPSDEILQAFHDFLVFKRYMLPEDLDDLRDARQRNNIAINAIKPEPILDFFSVLSYPHLVRLKKQHNITQIAILSFNTPTNEEQFVDFGISEFVQGAYETSASFESRIETGQNDSEITWSGMLIRDRFGNFCFSAASSQNNKCSFNCIITRRFDEFIVLTEHAAPRKQRFRAFLDQPASEKLKNYIKNSTLNRSKVMTLFRPPEKLEDEYNLDLLLAEGGVMDELSDKHRKATLVDDCPLHEVLMDAACVGDTQSFFKALLSGAEINRIYRFTKSTAAIEASHAKSDDILRIIYSEVHDRNNLREGYRDRILMNDRLALIEELALDTESFGGLEETLSKWDTALKDFNPLIRNERGYSASDVYPTDFIDGPDDSSGKFCPRREMHGMILGRETRRFLEENPECVTKDYLKQIRFRTHIYEDGTYVDIGVLTYHELEATKSAIYGYGGPVNE